MFHVAFIVCSSELGCSASQLSVVVAKYQRESPFREFQGQGDDSIHKGACFRSYNLSDLQNTHDGRRESEHAHTDTHACVHIHRHTQIYMYVCSSFYKGSEVLVCGLSLIFGPVVKS